MLVLIQLHLIAGVVKIWWADYLYTQAKNHLSIDEYEAGVTKLQQAIQLRPNQALFYDELANAYAEIAAQFSQLEEAKAAQEYAQLAIEAADTTLRLNPHQLNFYKTRSSVFTQLATLDPAYLQEANDALLAGQALAPTDPKLVYHQGLIVLAQGQTEKAVELIRQAIEMKPNYHQARYKLAQIYEQQENYAAALEEYRFILDYLIPNDRNLQQKVQELEKKLETM
jgi:tetratricopeptide (TPR) repeat protein